MPLQAHLQQLDDTSGSHLLPPGVLRVLRSKACRTALMFGDTLEVSRHTQGGGIVSSACRIESMHAVFCLACLLFQHAWGFLVSTVVRPGGCQVRRSFPLFSSPLSLCSVWNAAVLSTPVSCTQLSAVCFAEEGCSNMGRQHNQHD